MKKLTSTLVFALLAGCTLAQSDYQLFRPGVQYLYEDPNAIYGPRVLGMQIGDAACAYTYESVIAAEDGPPYDVCYRLVPAFAGRYVCQSDGLTRLNMGTEAAPQYVDLRPNAAVGEVWLATDAPYSIYGRADSVRWENTLGLWDSVKYICLYALDSAEELVPVSADGPIKISKQYGLVRGVYFHALTESLGAINLVGLSDPEVGLQNPDRSAFFQLRVGDTLHIRHYNTVSINGTWAHVTRLERSVLDEQWWDAAGARLYYVFRSERRTSSEGPGSDGLVRYETGVLDTFIYDWESLDYLDMQPGSRVGEADFPAFVSLWQSPFCATMGFAKVLSEHLFQYSDDCLGFGFDASISMPYYLSGFAGPYYSEVGLGGYYFRGLSYVGLLDGTSCGTPFDFVVGVQSPQAAEAPSFWPQPVRDVLHIRWPEAATATTHAVELWSSQGQLLGRYQVPAPVGTIDLSGLPAGTYWLRPTGGQRAWAVVKL